MKNTKINFDNGHDHSHNHFDKPLFKEFDSMKKHSIKASEFKAKCLSLMDEVNSTGDEYIITKNGIPIAKLVTASEQPQTLFGIYNDLIESSDVLSPIDESWYVES